MNDPHAAEAQERWGHTDAYTRSSARTATYTTADWEAIRSEADAIHQQFVSLMDAGEAPEAAAAIDVAEQHRAHISRWFYECPRAMHAGLGQMYITDTRFTDNIDKAAPGLAEFMAAAFRANYLRNA